MGSDVSRVRFNPLRHFAGVVQQQGRLVLDADWNESVAILDRRLRAQMIDVTSSGPDPAHAGVGWVPRQTPDAFRINIAGGGLTVGRGRMYVDGLVAENHGGPPFAWDPLLVEETGTTDTPYSAQPHWPTPEPIPGGGRHLAYLDVWQREVTHLEDPDLVEPAVGVDTTARLQTAWRVRLLPNVGQIDCATEDGAIPGWMDIIRSSAGRLTTDTVEVDQDEDPCDLPPTGGYRGLENQTYRVEIHTGGPPGTATFKWSRDNASVAMPVLEMVSTTVLRLASVGKDDVLRVSTGDWVEILDDWYELAGRPGEIRKVTVDDAARTITFGGAIPADLQPADSDEAAARHLRVRRWDQSGAVRNAAGKVLIDLDQPGAPGVIKVPTSAATQVVLENGVAVRFSTAAGAGNQFRAGDHWIFAARVANTWLEPLADAPPMGTHHHFARLGIVDLAAGTVTDCRRKWPQAAEAGEGCCTVSVGDGSTSVGDFTSIQAAVDFVAARGGGRVCVLPGDHRPDAPVAIESPGIAVSGCGLVSRINAPEGMPAFVVRTAERVAIETLMVLSTSREATISVMGCREVEIRQCAVGNSVTLGSSSTEPRLVEMVPEGEGRRQAAVGPAVAISDGHVFSLRDSVMHGFPAVSVQGDGATVHANRIHGGGVWVSDGSENVEIIDNAISGGKGPGVLLGGLLLDELPGEYIFGLSRIDIVGNRITNMSASGITTWSNFRREPSAVDERRSGPDTPVQEVTIAANEVRECANGELAAHFDQEALGGVVLRDVNRLRLSDNDIVDNGTLGRLPVCGVFLFACIGVDVTGNRISGNAPAVAEVEALGASRYQGALVAPLVTASYDRAVDREGLTPERFEVAVAERPQRGPMSTHALRLSGNTMVSPRGHALLVHAVGSVSVADSLLACHDVVAQPSISLDTGLPLDWLGVCVRIINLGIGLDTQREAPLGSSNMVLTKGGIPLDGRVLVHGNQLQFQVPDGSPFFEQLRERGFGAAVGLISNDDVSFQDNQVVLYARPTLG